MTQMTPKTMTKTIPLIDISGFDSPDPAARAAVAKQWDDAMSSVGFAIISGHGIPEVLLNGMYASTREFFDQPLETKDLCRDPDRNGQRGYLPGGYESVSQSQDGNKAPPDLCEAISFSEPTWEKMLSKDELARRQPLPNIWPAPSPSFKSPAFKETVVMYMEHAYRLAQKLMRISAVSLDLPEYFFAPQYGRMRHKLRLVQYPDQIDPPLPGQFRNGAHTDFSGFTILRQDDAPGGLQVKIGDDWVDVTPIPGTLVINAGDLLQRWTNDRWRSNLHRVINPPRDLTGSTRRISLVVFTGPDADADIACVPTCTGPGNPAKYPPIKAGEHTMQRIRETYAVEVEA